MLSPLAISWYQILLLSICSCMHSLPGILGRTFFTPKVFLHDEYIYIKLYYIPYSGKVWWGKSLANWLFSSLWSKKVLRINRSANRLLIVSTNLDGFSLANHGRFAKVTKLSPCHTFPLYGIGMKWSIMVCWLANY